MFKQAYLLLTAHVTFTYGITLAAYLYALWPSPRGSAVKLEYEMSLCKPLGSAVPALRENGGGGCTGGAGGGENIGVDNTHSSSDRDDMLSPAIGIFYK